jgi:hypothetical protein
MPDPREEWAKVVEGLTPQSGIVHARCGGRLVPDPRYVTARFPNWRYEQDVLHRCDRCGLPGYLADT